MVFQTWIRFPGSCCHLCNCCFRCRYDGAPLALLAEWLRLLDFDVQIKSQQPSTLKASAIFLNERDMLMLKPLMNWGAGNLDEDAFRADARRSGRNLLHHFDLKKLQTFKIFWNPMLAGCRMFSIAWPWRSVAQEHRFVSYFTRKWDEMAAYKRCLLDFCSLPCTWWEGTTFWWIIHVGCSRFWPILQKRKRCIQCMQCSQGSVVGQRMFSGGNIFGLECVEWRLTWSFDGKFSASWRSLCAGQPRQPVQLQWFSDPLGPLFVSSTYRLDLPQWYEAYRRFSPGRGQGLDLKRKKCLP